MILVTGASGFIGRHLLNLLLVEYGWDNVVALTSVPTDVCQFLLHNDYLFSDDYFLESGYKKINTVIHLGSYTPKANKDANLWQSTTQNISSTAKLLSSNLPLLEKFIFISTLDVYGSDAVISEESVTAPNSLYGYSKLYCEKMVESWARAENRVYQILRLGHVYGPGEEAYEKIIPVTIKKLLHRQSPEIWGKGEDIRSFIYIQDVIEAIIKSLQLTQSMGPINVVSDEQVSVRQLIEMIMNQMEVKLEIVSIEKTSVGRNLIFDNSKLKTCLINPKVPLAFGLMNEIEYMKQL